MVMLQVKHHKRRLESYEKNVYIWEVKSLSTNTWLKRRYRYKVSEKFYITMFSGGELLKYIKQ